MHKYFIKFIITASVILTSQISIADETIGELLFSPDGRLLASLTNNDTVQLWNVKTGEKNNEITGDYTDYIFFSPDGEDLALADHGWHDILPLYTRFGSIWHIDDNDLSDIPVYIWPSTTIQVSPDKRLTAEADKTGHIRLWDNTRKKISHLYHPDGIDRIYKMLFSPDNKNLIVIGGQKNTLIINFSLSEKQDNLILDTKGTFVYFQPNNHLLITKKRHSKKDIIEIWDSFSQPSSLSIEYIGGDVFRHVDISENGRFLAVIINSSQASVSDNASIKTSSQIKNHHVARVWDLKTRQPIHTFLNKTYSVTTLAISPDNKTLATHDEEGVIRLWNMNTGKMIKRLVTKKKGKTNE